MPSQHELIQLAGAVYGRRLAIGRWKRRRTYGRRSAAFHAALWTECDGHGAVFAVRGTANLAGMLQDLRLLCGREPRAWRRGLDAVVDARELIGSEPLLTGHSLGGAFAAALAVSHGLEAVTFNAPGMMGVLPKLRQRAAGVSLRNLCRSDDWIRQLSGDCWGTEVLVDGAAEGWRPRPGPRGVLEGLRSRRGSNEKLADFVCRSVATHGLRALTGDGSAAAVTSPSRHSPPRAAPVPELRSS